MNQRGMVLIAVLWVVAVISLVAFSLAASVRVEAESTKNSMDSERAFFMAKGAAEVVYSKFAANAEFPKDAPVFMENGDYVFPFEAGYARVRFESADGLIDLNAASDRLLASVFDSLGIAEELRNRIVDSVLDWRDADDIPHLYGAEINEYAGLATPRNGAFQSVDELLQVRYMTPDLFYGTVASDPVTGKYRRIPGVRDMFTIVSGRAAVNPNVASLDVLRALPGITPTLAEAILEQRRAKGFSDRGDMIQRVPALANSDAPDNMSFEALSPTALVARATLTSSGASRTVRLLFRREEKIQYITCSPLLYKRVQQIIFDRWQYQ